MASYRWLGAASSPLIVSLLLLLGSAHSLDTSGQGLAVVTVEQSPEMLFETQTVTLTCLIDGAGVIDANYTWLRDGGVELTGSESNVMLLGNQLSISNVSVSEWDGVCITCQAVTMITMGSGSINLTITTRSPTFTQHPANITVNKGVNFTLNCSAIGLPDPTIVLLKNGLRVLNFIAEEISNGVYLFTNADDHSVPGDYVCRATNINGVAYSYTATIVVRFAPELETQPEMTAILLGQSGLLNCTARGSPEPVISWTKNEEPLDLDNGRLEIVENGSLFLRDVRLNDTGDYKCNATNELGFDESDDAMLMINMYPVFMVVPGRMVHVELGDSITLECDAVAFPPANYFWFLVNCSTMEIIKSITTGNDLRVSSSEGVLTIESAMRSDRGCYRCVANNSLESSDINYDTTLKVSAPPLPPSMVRVDEVGSSWINVAWTEVDNYPTVVNYLVEYRLSDISPDFTLVDDSISAFTFSYNITSLYPNATYDVRVKARSPRGVGDPSLVVMETTLKGIPLNGRPENVGYNFTSPTSVNVSWTVPEVLLLTSYVRASVELRDIDGGMFMMEGVMDATFTGLTPATQYTLTLTFIFAGELSGPASSQTIITPDDIPGDAPSITSALATGPTTLLFTWTPPTIPNGNITYYNITTLPSTPSQPHLLDGSMMSYEVDGLRAFTDYTISLSASTSAGEGPANTTQVKTLEDVPPAPSALDIIPLNSTSLLVSWDPLASGDVPGILVNYMVKYNQLHHGHHPSYEVVPASETEITLVNLCPYTVYRVSVAAATGAGNGSFSDHTDSRTFGAIPEVKVQLRGLRKACPAGLLVEWEELRTKVLYGPIEEIMLVVNYSNLESGISNTSNISYYNGNTSYILEGLDVFTNYSVSVALSNINGTGPFSDPSTNVSCDGVAPAPEITNLTAINSTAVQVSWQPPSPEDVPGMIVNYIIMYAADGAERVIALPESSTLFLSSTLVISGLSPYTTYTVSIATETRYNTVGSFSDTWLVRTLGAVPDDLLTILSVSPSCPHFGLKVQWLRPNTSSFQGPEEDIYYVFSYTDVDDGETTNVSVPALSFDMINVTTLSYIISDVDIDTNYSVSVALENINGTGPPSMNVTETTPPEGIPSAPLNISVSAVNSTSLRVTWQPSTTPNGQPTYIIYYGPDDDTITPNDANQGMISSLSAYTNYTVRVAARTSCSETSSEAVVGLTAEDIPGEPANVIGVALPNAITVKWEEPSDPRGMITHYNVFCPDAAVATVVSSSLLVYDCSNLQPETSYEISVSAVNSAGNSSKNSMNVTTACNFSGSVVVEEMVGNMFNVSVSNCTNALYVLVVVRVVDIGNSLSKDLSAYNLEELIDGTDQYRIRNSRTRKKRQASNGEFVYIAANLTEAALAGGFTLGDGKDYGSYRNYQLEESGMYTVGLRYQVKGTDTPIILNSVSSEPITIAPTMSPSTTSTPTMTSSSPTRISLIPVVASAGAAGVVVIAICFVAIISCCCRCCSRSLDKLEAGGGSGRLERGGSFRLSRRKLVDPVDSFRNNHRTEALEDHPPIPVMGFLNKLSIMQTNDNQLFLEEFGSIEMAPQFSTDVANLPLNRAKNRYNNILPYDHSRVKLSSHKHSTDYINASYCAGYMKPKTYITTQGPTPESISDFWRMVWEQDSRTIIMLTNPFEKGKLKCEVYWPREIGASTMYGNIEVTLTDMTQLADYTIRNFTILKGGTTKEPREIRHFHFTSWPDHGVPQYATAMLGMLRRVKAWQPPPDTGPVIVHCSAGVGRSGTYIVIDTMLERLKNGDDTLDIYGHVSLLRTQRPYMVQTEDQYFFIHEAVAEALLCGVTEVKVDKLHSYVQELCSLMPEDEAGHTHMELQFKRLALDRNDPNRFQTATKDANKSKNRYVNVLPYENNRVCLEFMRGVDGSDYINASHVDSYHARRAFIATQGPLPNTVVDFWRMVWQYNVPVIVMLTECTEKGTERSACYWPTEVRTSETFGKFLVEMSVERNSTHYSYRDFNITNTECQQNRLVRQFHFHSWPEVGVPSNPMVLVEFIREVQKLYSSLNTKSPLVIHCSNGVGRTGVFIALHIILERLVVEGLADIFQTVKSLRIQRPAMVQSLDQYHFCYDATVDYVETTDMVFNMRQRSQSTVTAGSSESKRKSRPSNETTPSRSPARNSQPRHSGSLSRNTPARTESFKGSARNLELNQLGNGGSQIYGGSEGTSTFGNHRSSVNASPPPITTGSLSGSQVQLNFLQQNDIHGLSQQGLSQQGLSQQGSSQQGSSQQGLSQQGLSQPLSGSQPQLHFGSVGLGGGSQPKLNLVGGTASSQQSGYSGISDGLTFQPVQVRTAPVHQLAETQRYSTSSTNRSSYTGET